MQELFFALCGLHRTSLRLQYLANPMTTFKLRSMMVRTFWFLVLFGGSLFIVLGGAAALFLLIVQLW